MQIKNIILNPKHDYMKTKRILYLIVLISVLSPMPFGCSSFSGEKYADETKIAEDSLNYYYMSAYSLYSRFFIVGDSLFNDTVILDKSLNLLNKGLTIDSDNMKIHNLKCMIYVFKHCYKEALYENDVLLKISNNNPETIFARATIYDAMGDYEKSETAVNECLFLCDSLLEHSKLEKNELYAIMHLSLMATEYIYGSDAAVEKANDYMNMYPDIDMLKYEKGIYVRNKFDDNGIKEQIRELIR